MPQSQIVIEDPVTTEKIVEKCRSGHDVVILRGGGALAVPVHVNPANDAIYSGARVLPNGWLRIVAEPGKGAADYSPSAVLNVTYAESGSFKLTDYTAAPSAFE